MRIASQAVLRRHFQCGVGARARSRVLLCHVIDCIDDDKAILPGMGLESSHPDLMIRQRRSYREYLASGHQIARVPFMR